MVGRRVFFPPHLPPNMPSLKIFKSSKINKKFNESFKIELNF